VRPHLTQNHSSSAGFHLISSCGIAIRSGSFCFLLLKSDTPPQEQKRQNGNAIHERQYAQSHRLRAQGISAAAKEF